MASDNRPQLRMAAIEAGEERLLFLVVDRPRRGDKDCEFAVAAFAICREFGDPLLRTGLDELMMPTGSYLQEPQDISPDGRLLVYVERTAGGFHNFWTMPVRGTSAPTRLRQSQADEENLRFAPGHEQHAGHDQGDGRDGPSEDR